MGVFWLVVLVFLAGYGRSEVDQELTLSSWLPPQHLLVTQAILPWAAEVEAVTEGRVRIRIAEAPLGPPPAHFQLAHDGDADITYGLHSFHKDERFARSRVGEFSFIGDSAEAASPVYWQIYSELLNANAEHQGTKLLSLWLHGPGMVHIAGRVMEAPEDFRGLQLRVPGGYVADLIAEMGAVPQFMAPGHVRDRIAKGEIDGMTFPSEALYAFGLSEHVTESISFPGGLYNTSWFLVMNEAVWAKILPEDQARIEALSGAAMAKRAGKAWDEADMVGLLDAMDQGVEILLAPPAVVAFAAEIGARLEQKWAVEVAAGGYDGLSALTALRARASPWN